MPTIITSSLRLPSGEGHDTIIKSENFATKDKFANYVLEFLNKQHELSSGGMMVFKTYLSSPDNRITYRLSTNPGIFYIEKSETFVGSLEIPPIQETAKKVSKAVSTARDPSERMKIFDFSAANQAHDPMLKAFFHSSDFETIFIESSDSATKTTYTHLSSDYASDDESDLSSEDDDTVIV